MFVPSFAQSRQTLCVVFKICQHYLSELYALNLRIRNINYYLAFGSYLYHCCAVSDSFKASVPRFDIVNFIKADSFPISVSYDNADRIIVFAGKINLGSYRDQAKRCNNCTITCDNNAGWCNGKLQG